MLGIYIHGARTRGHPGSRNKLRPPGKSRHLAPAMGSAVKAEAARALEEPPQEEPGQPAMPPPMAPPGHPHEASSDRSASRTPRREQGEQLEALAAAGHLHPRIRILDRPAVIQNMYTDHESAACPAGQLRHDVLGHLPSRAELAKCRSEMVTYVSGLTSLIRTLGWAMGNNHRSTVCVSSDMLSETVKVLTEFAQALISQQFWHGLDKAGHVLYETCSVSLV